MSEWYVPFTHVQFDMTKLINRQNRNTVQNVKSVQAFRFHHQSKEDIKS